MLKLVTKKQKTYWALQQNRFLRHFFKFDLNALDQIDDSETYTQVLDSLKMANQTYKTTWSRRFSELDNALVRHLPRQKQLRIHDLAASDGVTSIELFDRLESEGFEFSLAISDKFLFLRKKERAGFTIFVVNDGHMVGGSVLRIYADPEISNRFPISKWLGRLGKRLTEGSESQELTPLLNPAVKQHERFEKIRVSEVDIFDWQDQEKYDFIRCMNVLNPRYFSEGLIRKAVNNIKANLVESGLFLVGRTDIESRMNHATLFELKFGRLNPLEAFNDGSEVSNICTESS